MRGPFVLGLWCIERAAPAIVTAMGLSLNQYFRKFIVINFGRDHMIVETDLTQCFCLDNFKGNQLPPASRVLKLLEDRVEFFISQIFL